MLSRALDSSPAAASVYFQRFYESRTSADFEVLHKHFHRRLTTVIGKRTQPDLVADVEQETWIKVLEYVNKPERAPIDNPIAWITNIAQHAAVDLNRRARYRGLTHVNERKVTDARALYETYDEASLVASKSAARQWHRYECVVQVIKSLPSARHRAIGLMQLQDYSPTIIASELHVAKSTVEKWRHRLPASAIEALKDC